MTSASEIIRALKGRWHGSYGTARCPAHHDKNPSFSAKDTGGTTLVKCHAGCPQDAVLAALRDRCLWRRDARQLSPSEARTRLAREPDAAARTGWGPKAMERCRYCSRHPR